MAPAVIVVCGRDPQLGFSGHPSFTRAHARAIKRAGREPHLFCPGAPEAVIETDFGIVHRVGMSRLRAWTEGLDTGLRKSFLGFDGPRLASAMARFARDQGRGPHVIHGISTWGYASVLAAESLRAMRIEVATVNHVYTTVRDETDAKVRGLPRGSRLYDRLRFSGERFWLQQAVGRLERRAYAESRVVAVNYESVRRLFEDEYGPGPEIRRLPYAPESAFVHEPCGELPALPEPIVGLASREAPLIVSVSRHDPRKGVDVLIRALDELRRAGVPFRACITSGGELLEAHRQLVSRLGLAGSVVLTGWVPDPFVYLRHADVFALPSLQEGSGSLALLEALQAGAAVVASGIDGILEDVTDGDSALLVEPGNPVALSRALARALGDADLRRHLARRARETFLQRFSADVLTQGLQRTWADLGVT